MARADGDRLVRKSTQPVAPRSLLTSGHFKPIEQVQPHDRVLSRDQYGQTIAYQPVEKTYPSNHPQGFINQHAFDRHYFHPEKGIPRDPAHTDSVPIETLFNEYARLNNLEPIEILNYMTISPYSP